MQAEMSDSLDAAQDNVALARTLVDHLETGNQHEAMSVLAQLAGFRDSVLFQQLGRLARELLEIQGMTFDEDDDWFSSLPVATESEALQGRRTGATQPKTYV